MSFLTKKHLTRRTILRGLGVTVSLPLLDAMFPAFTALARAQARPRTRFGAIYIANGAIMEQWIPDAVGSGFAFKPILAPIEPFKEQVVVVTQPAEGQFKAFSATCTHKGCMLAGIEDGAIICKCHGARFNVTDGSVAKGPATAPLTSRNIKVSGDAIALA